MRLRPISLIVFPLAFSLIALKYFPVPYLWIFFFWACIGLLGTFSFHRPFLRLGSFNFGVIMLILFSLKSYYYLGHSSKALKNDKQRLENVYSYINEHPVLGRANTANSQYVARKFYDNQLVYEASITINGRGLRITTPEGSRLNQQTNLLFFLEAPIPLGKG